MAQAVELILASWSWAPATLSWSEHLPHGLFEDVEAVLQLGVSQGERRQEPNDIVVRP